MSDNTHLVCPICKCRFGSLWDYLLHEEAHRTQSINLPSMKNKKWTYYKLMKAYKTYIENYGRELEQQTMQALYENGTEVISYRYEDEDYQRLRESKLKEAHNECELCKSKLNPQCHHIIPATTDPDLFLNPINIIVLCETCHQEIHQEYTKIRRQYELQNSGE